jgi:hypothetical protein
MHIRSKVVRCGVWVVLGFVAGCETDGELPTSGLVVTVLRDSPAVPANGAIVSVGMPPAALVTDASGKAFFLVPPGTYAVGANLTSYCTATTSATVTTGTATNVTISLGPPCVGSGSDRITTGGSEPLRGLVDIRIGTGPPPCENDLLVEGTSGTADLMTNALTLSGPGSPCHGAAWVFTEDHAPWFDNTPATFPWTNSGGDVLTATLPANRLRVPVSFWIADPLVNDAEYRAKLTDPLGGDLSIADGFLRAMHTGLRLTNSETADTPPDVKNVATQGIGRGCDDTSSITATPPVYNPPVYNANHINIYVVDAIDGPGSPSGRTCIAYGAKNVIFIISKATHVTLLHEIGHALGLYRPSWGHADEINQMKPENVMKSGASVAGHLTLGQIVRAHADTTSWINQITGIGTVRDRQLTLPLVTPCQCPGDTATLDCPMITKDIFRPGAAGMGTTDPACHVVVDKSCLPLSGPSMTGTITVRGFTDDMATKDGFGEGVVGSLAPTIATATLSPLSDGKTAIAEVKAISPGTTDVLISLGGTFARVKVKVGAACP